MKSNMMVKTSGYQVNETTFATFRAGVGDGNYGSTSDGRLYWSERNDVDLAGLQLQDKVFMPKQMNIQETYAPRAFGLGIYNDNTKQGQKPNCEIHDIFSTVRLSTNTIDLYVASLTNANTNQNNYPGLPVSFEPTVHIGFTDQTNFGGGLLDTDFRDTEQIVAGRSRRWMADLNGFDETVYLLMDAAVKGFPMRLTFDSSWGSGDAIASDYLHHVRIFISTMDRSNVAATLPELPTPPTGWFIIMPPSIQYLTGEVVKPSFIEQMTMVRRSRAI